jgi:hypothetical protein
LTWALLLALNAQSRLRVPLWMYAGLLGLAAILLGEHYWIDLIVAVPYTFAMQWLATRWPSYVATFRPVSAATAPN